MVGDEIKTDTYSSEDLEIGGNFVKRFRPSEFREQGIKQKVFTVKSYKGSVDTQWGPRAEWVMTDDYDDFVLTSWAFVSEKKFSAVSLVGKRIKLEAKDDKRVILHILD